MREGRSAGEAVRRDAPRSRRGRQGAGRGDAQGQDAGRRAGRAPGAPCRRCAGPRGRRRRLNGAANEEQRIESAKYLPRHAPKRLFEDERFVFPESYGVNRVRLLVKDPEWLFAHWDVDPAVLAAAASELGERALALSRLTLRLSDTGDGGSTVILLPKAARGLVHPRRRGVALLPRGAGLTLPSGEFRALAASNTVGTPRVGPAARARATAPRAVPAHGRATSTRGARRPGGGAAAGRAAGWRIRAWCPEHSRRPGSADARARPARRSQRHLPPLTPRDRSTIHTT